MDLYGPDERCFYVLLHAPRDHHDRLLHDLVIPVVREIRADPRLDSLFFARYNQPDWQLRFRVLGRPDWVEGPVRRLVESRLDSVRERGLVTSWEFGMYQRELERYGGDEGMRLSERIFLHDTLACLDLLEAETRGSTRKPRREYSLVFVEEFLDLVRFDRERRIAFYREGFAWAVDGGDWLPDDLRLLEKRYQGLKEGLLALFGPGGRCDPAARYGGEEPARIARACLEATRPVADELVRAHDAGRIPQDLGHIAWSLAHMHANRLGLDPAAEAILRFFMHRLHTDESIVPG